MVMIRSLREIVAASLIIGTVAINIGPADACVGKTIHIAVVDDSTERMMAELIAVLLNERTGTEILVTVYSGHEEILALAKTGEVGILIENTDRAMERLGKKKRKTVDAYETSKKEYQKRYNLIWLEPLNSIETEKPKARQYVPVITTEVMRNFPALPRVINKLALAIDSATLHWLLAAFQRDSDLRTVALDFLRSKRLI